MVSYFSHYRLIRMYCINIHERPKTKIKHLPKIKPLLRLHCNYR